MTRQHWTRTQRKELHARKVAELPEPPFRVQFDLEAAAAMKHAPGAWGKRCAADLARFSREGDLPDTKGEPTVCVLDDERQYRGQWRIAVAMSPEPDAVEWRIRFTPLKGRRAIRVHYVGPWSY